ncbi:BamA/TamA family outer membrane protein [Enterobacter hormaechei]
MASHTWAASMIDPADDRVDMSDYLQNNSYGFLPIPVVITEPAVGYGGGLFGLFLHGKGKHVDNRFIPPAMTAIGGGGTPNGTWFIGCGHRNTWQADRIRYLMGAGYANINLDIYSGDIAGFDYNRSVEAETRGHGGRQKLLFRVGDSPFFIGASQFWAKMDISAPDNPVIDRIWKQVLGETSISSGLGVMAEYDSTDNFFLPGRGVCLSGEYQFFGHTFGGDYRYDLLTLDAKYYVQLTSRWTLSLAGNYQMMANQQTHLSPMARPYIQLRGISRYRYQGDDVSTVQTQLA